MNFNFHEKNYHLKSISLIIKEIYFAKHITRSHHSILL